MHQLSGGLATCVILYLDPGYTFAAAPTQQISVEANFGEVVLSVLKMSKFSRYVVHIVLGVQLKGREVTSVHCERHSVSLREAPGHLASQAPAGKMRTHLVLDSGVCVRVCYCVRLCAHETREREAF